MPAAMSSEQLKEQLRGLFSFPVTPFSATNEIDLRRYRQHLQWMIEAKPAAIFVCGGTGELFSLDLAEYQALVKVAVEESRGKLPVVAGIGYGTQLALHFAKAAGEAGADGLLVMPPYLIQSEQEGLYQHYRRLAISTSLGLIIYQRDNAILSPATADRLAGLNNIIGLKDGHGDMERLLRIRLAVGDRLVFINGMPTAELSAQAFEGLGILNYSSAVFNFVPALSQAFYRALTTGDTERVSRLLQGFFRPFAELRDRQKGYAVSLIKAGLKVIGKSAGGVRPPLVNPSAEDEAHLKSIIDKGLAILKS
jgi:5-dehydro-4-deoxyglucarate dehydratase